MTKDTARAFRSGKPSCLEQTADMSARFFSWADLLAGTLPWLQAFARTTAMIPIRVSAVMEAIVSSGVLAGMAPLVEDMPPLISLFAKECGDIV